MTLLNRTGKRPSPLFSLPRGAFPLVETQIWLILPLKGECRERKSSKEDKKSSCPSKLELSSCGEGKSLRSPAKVALLLPSSLTPSRLAAGSN